MNNRTHLIEDVKWLFEAFETIHPNLFYNSDESEIKADYQKLLAELDQTEEVLEIDFYRKVAPIISKLNDGHTTSFPGLSLNNYISNGNKFIPIDIDVEDGNLVISKVFGESSHLHEGHVILSINGLSSNHLIETMKKYVSGEDEQVKSDMITTYFRFFLWIIFDFRDSFEITYLEGSAQASTVLAGVTYDEIGRELERDRDSLNNSRLVYENDYAVLSLPTFENYDHEKDLISQYFEDIRDKNIRKLIIDLRVNGGGDSRVGDTLLSHLISKPFRQFSKIQIKISEPIKEYYRSDKYIRDYYKVFNPQILLDVENAICGDLVEFEGQDVQPSNIQYDGEVILLTSKKTYSSATCFTSAFVDYKIGTLIGESPGGYASSYGDQYLFTLVHSGLEVIVSHKYHIRPNGDPSLSKIMPDIQVNNSSKRSINEFIDLLEQNKESM